jgi:hypothetical protein
VPIKDAFHFTGEKLAPAFKDRLQFKKNLAACMNLFGLAAQPNFFATHDHLHTEPITDQPEMLILATENRPDLIMVAKKQ